MLSRLFESGPPGLMRVLVGFKVEGTPWRSIVANMPRVSESYMYGVGVRSGARRV
jgi:hypothetical protein